MDLTSAKQIFLSLEVCEIVSLLWTRGIQLTSKRQVLGPETCEPFQYKCHLDQSCPLTTSGWVSGFSLLLHLQGSVSFQYYCLVMCLYDGPNQIKFIRMPRGLLSLGRHDLSFTLSWRNEAVLLISGCKKNSKAATVWRVAATDLVVERSVVLFLSWVNSRHLSCLINTKAERLFP